MITEAENETHCPLCNESKLLNPFWKSPAFFQCGACKLIFRVPFPDTAALEKLYHKSWNAPETSRAETGSTDSRLAETIVKYLLRSTKSSSFAGKRILDFGGGMGAMATALKKQGADVIVVEPFGVDYLKNLGFDAYANLDEIPEELSFDGITSLEVVEHVLDPAETLSRLGERLAPGGWLLVTTPNPEGLTARLAGQEWREAQKPGHILFFPPSTLQSTLRQLGFDSVERQRWLLRFPNASSRRAALHYLLQATFMDGSLRVLARKACGQGDISAAS